MWIKVLEQGLDILVLCFLPGRLKKLFWMPLPALKQNQGKPGRGKKSLLRVGSREEKQREGTFLVVHGVRREEKAEHRGLQSGETLLYNILIVATCHHIFVQTL